MKPERIHLKVRSHPENLTHIRGVIADVTAKTSLSKQDLGGIILAVDEALSNIIKHSYKNDHTRDIDLTIQLKADILIISIIDDGIKFDFDAVKSRDISEIKPGGLGIYIIQQVMDTIEYSHTKEGFNKIKMVKKLFS